MILLNQDNFMQKFFLYLLVINLEVNRKVVNFICLFLKHLLFNNLLIISFKQLTNRSNKLTN